MFVQMLRMISKKLKNVQNSLHHFSTTGPVKMCNIEEHRIQLKDSRQNTYNINFVRKGQGNNVILLLPGALGSVSTHFQPQIDQLPNLLPNFLIIAWDPPGYGKSRPPNRNLDLDNLHRDAFLANELMQSLKLYKYSVLGWSNGGITGLVMAAKYRNSIEKLIIWGTKSYILPEEAKYYERIRDVSILSDRMREPMEKLYGLDYFPKLWSDWIDSMLNMYEHNDGDICRNELAQIRAKTLIMHGAKDPIVAAEHIPFLRKSIKNTEYHELPNGKHNIHLRYAQEFNEIVANFLLNKL